MKRSEINAAIARAIALIEEHRWRLPPWAHWTAEDYAKGGATAKYLREHQMGWDVTDFGKGDFARLGITLFCVRNGIQSDARGKPYAEKLIVMGEGQVCPSHRHKVKMEDIINRGGGLLAMEFAQSDRDGRPTEAEVKVFVDGAERTLKPWEKLLLKPGESVTVERGVYHRFTAEPGHGIVLVGEVSQVNDDLTDNYFLEPVGRFAKIEEDASPLRRLWNEAA